MVWANSALIADTFLRSATIRPVRYSAKCQRSGGVGEHPAELVHGFLDYRRKGNNTRRGPPLTSSRGCGRRGRPYLANILMRAESVLPKTLTHQPEIPFLQKSRDNLQRCVWECEANAGGN